MGNHIQKPPKEGYTSDDHPPVTNRVEKKWREFQTMPETPFEADRAAATVGEAIQYGHQCGSCDGAHSDRQVLVELRMVVGEGGGTYSSILGTPNQAPTNIGVNPW